MKFLRSLFVALGVVALVGGIKAMADYTVTQGSGTTIFAFTCFTTKVCPAAVPVTSAGAEISPATAALQGAQTSGGLTAYFVQPTASDNHANIKNGAGQVYKVSVTNNSATVNYLRLYNAASGFNGCNSATNLMYQMAIPASTSGAGYSDSWEFGMAFSTGISICVTSGYATNDTTNATASAMSVNVGYK